MKVVVVCLVFDVFVVVAVAVVVVVDVIIVVIEVIVFNNIVMCVFDLRRIIIISILINFIIESLI